MIITCKSDHSGDEESKSYRNDTEIPRRPEVSGVERRTSVPEFSKLVVGKCCKPGVEHDFWPGYGL